MTEVWVVEHRIQFLDKRRYGFAIKTPEHYFESVVAHVSSSKDKAIDWCRRNLDYDAKLDRRPWWFAITREVVDSDELVEESHLFCVYWDGEVGTDQPVYGYAEMREDR